MLIMLLMIMFLIAFHFEPVWAISEAPLADQINACLSEVTSWKGLVDIGVVMHKSSLTDFDTWITSRANASDWEGVFAVKRYAEQAGYSSRIIDTEVKLALSSIPMFSDYSLPKTDTSGSGYFWPWDRYVLYGYRYAEELNWETGRWNKTSGFLALKSVRDWYGRAFYRCNPDIPAAESLYGTRWHEAGSLMDCFFIFYKLGVKDALNYAVKEWAWLNNKLWSNDHFDYAPLWRGWEFSGTDVFPNVAKLHLNGTSLGNWSRVIADLQFRYISSSWNSPQWHRTYEVAEHHDPGNSERRLDGTLDAWIMLNTFYDLLNSGNQTNMKNMLEGNGVTQAWIGLNASDLRQTATNIFRLTSSSHYSAGSTALAALCLFLMGISPQEGRGLAIPLISDRHSDYSSLNYRHFEFDYTNHKIKIPVWGGTTLKFMYGKTYVTEYFGTTGIYNITFASDWNSISQATEVSTLYSNEYYLWVSQVHDAYEKTYNDSQPQVLSEIDTAQSANYEGPDAKSLVSQAVNEYNLAVFSADQGNWQDAVSHLQAASDLVMQAYAKEEQYQLGSWGQKAYDSMKIASQKISQLNDSESSDSKLLLQQAQTELANAQDSFIQVTLQSYKNAYNFALQASSYADQTSAIELIYQQEKQKASNMIETAEGKINQIINIESIEAKQLLQQAQSHLVDAMNALDQKTILGCTTAYAHAQQAVSYAEQAYAKEQTYQQQQLILIGGGISATVVAVTDGILMIRRKRKPGTLAQP